MANKRGLTNQHVILRQWKRRKIMKQLTLKIGMVCILLLVINIAATGDQYPIFTKEQLMKNANSILTGTVKSVKDVKRSCEENSGYVRTVEEMHIQVDIHVQLKGNIPDSTLILRIPMSLYEGLVTTGDAAKFITGNQLLLFVCYINNADESYAEVYVGGQYKITESIIDEFEMTVDEFREHLAKQPEE